MKWMNDPPRDWENAPEEPPAGRSEHVPLQSELLVNGVVIREPGSSEAYLYASDGSVDVEDHS